MLILYLDTTTGRWYDANGIELENSSPQLAFQSRERICIRTVTATSDTMPLDSNPATWIRDTQWADKLAKVTVDNDYVHKLRGDLIDDISAGSVTRVKANIANVTDVLIPTSGTVRMFSTPTDCETLEYTSRSISGNEVVFDVSSNVAISYPSGARIDCPQAPFFEADVDIENSDPANGEFQFELVVDSLRLRESMLYTGTATLASQGLELLFYRVTETGNEPVRAYLCKTFVVTGTIGDVDYSGDLPDENAIDRAYQILASFVSQGIEVQLSVNGTEWFDYPATSVQAKATVWRFRYHATKGEWSPAIPLVAGKEGKSAYDVAVSLGFAGTESAWIQSLKGPVGQSAYDSAVENGFDGDITEWLESLKGPAGTGLYYDVSGATLAEKALYDNRPEGFKFAIASVDNVNRATNLDIYTKLSNSYGDWSEPMRVVVFGTLPPEITAVMPIEFAPPPSDGVYYFGIDVSANPFATVAQVCIDTADGEMVLPYYSDLGVRKILKKDGLLLIYFGSSIPTYQTGRVYLTQMVAADKAQGNNGGSMTPVNGSMYYGYLPSSADFQRVSEITSVMLQSSTITKVAAASVGSITLGNVPAGSFTVVLVPENSGLTVTKNDGLGGNVQFEIDNGIQGSGSNGAKVVVDGIGYKVYGEFNLVDGVTTVFVE